MDNAELFLLLDALESLEKIYNEEPTMNFSQEAFSNLCCAIYGLRRFISDVS